MGHYAQLDENNIVTQVTVGKDEGEGGVDWEQYYDAKRTSYSTRGGVHIDGGKPFRKNFAGIGFKYDAERDAFIPPQPYKSWTLNENSCLWEPPVAMPQDGQIYDWDDAAGSWIKKGK